MLTNTVQEILLLQICTGLIHNMMMMCEAIDEVLQKS